MPFTNCQKKEGSHPLSVRRICPFTEEAPEGLPGVHLLVVAITTKRLPGSATQEKAEVPPSALFDAFITSRMMHLYVRCVTNPPPSVEPLINDLWCESLRHLCCDLGITGEQLEQTLMEFALLALFTCSLASVVATVFNGRY